MHKYKQLKVWEKSYEFVLQIYKISEGFPKAELYGLTSQIRRAAVSIPANIAEGSGKSSNKDFHRYLQISFGSINEVEVYLNIAKDLNYLDENNFVILENNLIEIRRMLSGLIDKLKCN